MTSLKDITHSLILTAGLLVLPLSGCDTGTVSHHYCHIPPEGWRRNDTVCLHTDTLQQDGTYQLSIGLRCNDKYPYKSIWVVIENYFSPPLFAWHDTVECQLVDSLNRMQRGIRVYQYDIPASRRQLHKGQAGQIRIWHYMQQENLPGIMDVGIRIQRTQ